MIKRKIKRYILLICDEFEFYLIFTFHKFVVNNNIIMKQVKELNKARIIEKGKEIRVLALK